MEVDCLKETQWRSRLSEAFAANIVGKPFKWASQEVILLDVKINNVVLKAFYSPK